MSDEQQYGPGVKKYIKESEKILAQREEQIARIKKYKFDTLAVHGLYTVDEALNLNQGSVIEPLYLSTAQSYRNADEMELSNSRNASRDASESVKT